MNQRDSLMRLADQFRQNERSFLREAYDCFGGCQRAEDDAECDCEHRQIFAELVLSSEHDDAQHHVRNQRAL